MDRHARQEKNTVKYKIWHQRDESQKKIGPRSPWLQKSSSGTNTNASCWNWNSSSNAASFIIEFVGRPRNSKGVATSRNDARFVVLCWSMTALAVARLTGDGKHLVKTELQIEAKKAPATAMATMPAMFEEVPLRRWVLLWVLHGWKHAHQPNAPLQCSRPYALILLSVASCVKSVS